MQTIDIEGDPRHGDLRQRRADTRGTVHYGPGCGAARPERRSATGFATSTRGRADRSGPRPRPTSSPSRPRTRPATPPTDDNGGTCHTLRHPGRPQLSSPSSSPRALDLDGLKLTFTPERLDRISTTAAAPKPISTLCQLGSGRRSSVWFLTRRRRGPGSCSSDGMTVLAVRRSRSSVVPGGHRQRLRHPRRR